MTAQEIRDKWLSYDEVDSSPDNDITGAINETIEMCAFNADANNVPHIGDKLRALKIQPQKEQSELRELLDKTINNPMYRDTEQAKLLTAMVDKLEKS
jgi:hypothetical protein